MALPKEKIQDLIGQFLLAYKPSEVSTIDIESKVPGYAHTFFDVMHTASTYSREWRRFKDPREKSYIGFGIKQINTIQEKPYGKWEIIWR